MDNSQHPQAAHQAALSTLNNWQQQYATQNTDAIPHDTVAQALSQWVSQAPPDQQQAAASHALAQLNPQQRADLGTTIFNLLGSNGLNPQTVGIQATNPAQISANDLTNLT